MAVNPELAAGWTAQKQNRPAVTSVVRSTPANNVAAVATADATDLPTAQALANALKVALNAEIAALKAAGLQKTS